MELTDAYLDRFGVPANHSLRTMARRQRLRRVRLGRMRRWRGRWRQDLTGGVMGEATAFWAIIRKVQTLTDGSLNVTLNLPENAIPEAAELMAYQVHGVVVDVTVTPRVGEQQDESGPNTTISRTTAKRRN